MRPAQILAEERKIKRETDERNDVFGEKKMSSEIDDRREIDEKKEKIEKCKSVPIAFFFGHDAFFELIDSVFFCEPFSFQDFFQKKK